MPEFEAQPGLGHSRVIASIVIMGLIMAGCSSEEAMDSWVEADQLTLTESVRIGDSAAGDTVYFYYPQDVKVDSKGRLLVTDWSVDGFRVFDADGVLLHEVGSEGDAPGEFNNTPDLFIGPKDSVYAYDNGNYRLSVFAPSDYEFEYALRLEKDAVSHAYPSGILAVLQDKMVVVYQHPDPEGLEEGLAGSLEIKVLDRGGRAIRDSLALMPSTEMWMIIDEARSVPVFWGPMFRRSTQIAWSNEHLVHYGWNEEINIKALSLDGSLPHEFTVAHAAVPVTSAEKERFEDSIEKRKLMPDTKPAFGAMVPDDEGQLWLRLSAADGALEREWIVVSGQSGDVTGTFRLSKDATLREIRNGMAYGSVRGDGWVIQAWEIAQ